MATQIYGDILKKRLGRNGHQRYLQNHWIHALAIVGTFHYFCFSCLFFTADCSTIWSRVLDGIASLGLSSHAWSAMADMALPAVALSALATVAIAWWHGGTAVALLNAAKARLPQSPGALFAALFAKTAAISFVLLIVWALQQTDPVVVYMRF
jgi:hypothetical protein